MKVVVIEDEKAIIDAVNLAFEFRWPGVKLAAAMTGKDGIGAVKKESPDVVILDINLPDLSGFDVLKEIRTFSSVPVIILTVRSDDADMLRGLEGGADDYIIKPFNYLTLLARVKTVLRRTEKTSLKNGQSISVGSRLKIDIMDQKVRLDDKPVKLTPVEYRLLVLLVKNKDKVVGYRQIMEEIWEKDECRDTENVRIYIRRLRKKLQDTPPNLILNKHGSGYMLKS
ncbi:MAG: response regulator transcription factor [Dehalococcoidales bacterium]|nr:response regulator transcription factor [Dehalococcoidales bacterium]